MFYFNSLEMITSVATMDSFADFLESIIESGVEDIHIITHSMGIKLFLTAMKSQKVLDCLRPVRNTRRTQSSESLIEEEQQTKKLNLVTCTFLNPDYSVREFRDENYSTLRTYTSRISLYVDKGDNALRFAAMFTRALSLGRLDTPLYSSPECTTLLDVDLIDISGLQDNMHSVRHSAFFVNRLMLEDLREIIAERKRASYRLSRLVHKRGNVYCFMTTPAAVTSERI